MEFFCYHRDRQGSMGLRRAVLEQQWGYMDNFADRMVAHGPTFADDGTLTGSVHIVDLPDVTAARAFAFDEPGYQAGGVPRRRAETLAQRLEAQDLGLRERASWALPPSRPGSRMRGRAELHRAAWP